MGDYHMIHGMSVVACLRDWLNRLGECCQQGSRVGCILVWRVTVQGDFLRVKLASGPHNRLCWCL